MPYQIEPNKEERIVRIRLAGEVPTDELLAAIDEMETEGVRHYGQLWDFRKGRFAAEPAEIADVVRSGLSRRKKYGRDAGKVAIVSTQRTQLGRLLETRLNVAGLEVRAFAELDEAGDWLAR